MLCKALIVGEGFPAIRCNIEAASLGEFRTELSRQLTLVGADGKLGENFEFYDPAFKEWCVCSSFDLLPEQVKIRISGNGSSSSTTSSFSLSPLSTMMNNNNNNVLKYCPHGSLDYNECKQLVETKCVFLNGDVTASFSKPVLECVEKVVSDTLERNFHIKRGQLVDPDNIAHNMLLLVENDVVEEILTEGLSCPEEPGPFGKGICCTSKYCATLDNKEGGDDDNEEEEESSNNKTNNGDVAVGNKSIKLLICDVAVGRPLVVQGPNPLLSFEICNSQDCDSVSVSMQELLDQAVVVVYHPHQLLPKYVITISPTRHLGSNYCKEHGEELKIFCCSCCCCVCLMCLHLGSHLGHDYQSLNVAHKKELLALKQKMGDFSEVAAAIEGRVVEVEIARDQVMEESEVLRKIVRNQAQGLLKIIEEREMALMQKIDVAVEKKMMEMNELESRYQDIGAKMNNILVQANQNCQLDAISFLNHLSSFEDLYAHMDDASKELISQQQQYNPFKADSKLNIDPCLLREVSLLLQETLHKSKISTSTTATNNNNNNNHHHNIVDSTMPIDPSLFWRSGVLKNIDIHVLRGWTLVYHKPYSHPTTIKELEQVGFAGSRILIAARKRDKPNNITTAAMGMRFQVLLPTNGVNECHAANDVFWYCKNEFSFGFSDVASVHLNPGDQSERNNRYRLSWHLNGMGGFRAGKHCNLNESDEYEKLIFVAP